MGQMNIARAGHGNSTENPFDSIGKAIAGRSNNMQQAILQSGMQGAEHAHELTMQSNQHGHEQNLAIIGGATELGKARIAGRSAVHVARAQGASQVSMAQIQADAGLKEQAAGHRHEVRLGERQHQQGLEQTAQENHLATGLVGSLMRHAEPGTGLQFNTAGGTTAAFTTRQKTLRAKASAAPKPHGPQLIGMPVNIATAGKPAAPASPAVAAKTQRYAHRDPVTNKISHYEDTPQVLKPAKKTAKKAAPKKKK